LNKVKINILRIVAIILLLAITSCAPENKNSLGDSLFIEDLTSEELNDKIERGYSTVLIYSGGTEATGPHIVLGKHNYKVKTYAEKVAKGLGNTLVAPILPFAPNYIDLKQFSGTISLDSLTFSHVNEQVALSMMQSGFTHIVFMCDHYDSQQPLKELADKLSSDFRNQNVDFYYASDGYAKARSMIEKSIKERGIVAGGHGGHWDTSEAMAISSELVRPEFFEIGDTTKEGNFKLDERGVSGDPRNANAKDGQEYADLRIEKFVQEIQNHILNFKHNNSNK